MEDRYYLDGDWLMDRQTGQVMYDDIRGRAGDLLVEKMNELDAMERSEAAEYLRRLMRAVFLHYHNRTDLDPVQQKHYELACEARKRLHS